MAHLRPHYRPLDAEYALTADTGDEELPAPGDLDPRWVRRLRRPVYAALLLLAGGVTVLHMRTGSVPTAAAPVAPEPTFGVDVDVAQPALVHRAAPGLVSDDVACPPDASCRTSTTLPPGSAAALRAAFPGYVDPSAHTVTESTPAGTRLVGRFLHVTTGSADVTVQVTPGASPASTTRTGSGASAIVVVERTVAAATIRVTVGGPGASDRPGAAALRLATDPRLVALS